jgi:hypothetical protein
MTVPEGSSASSADVQILVRVTETGKDGKYALEDLPHGRYYIVAGLLDFPTYLPGVKTTAEARVMTIQDGEKFSNQDFKLSLPGPVRIAGRITGLADGQPTTSIRALLLADVNTEPRVTIQVPIQADGRFEFLRVPPADYLLRIVSSERPAGRVQALLKIDGQRHVDGIEVPAARLKDSRPDGFVATISIPAHATMPVFAIRGKIVTVAGAGMPSRVLLRAFALAEGPMQGTVAEVHPDGAFEFFAAPSGEYDVIVPDWQIAPGVRVEAGRNFTFRGRDVVGLEVRLPTEVRGRVVMEDGAALPAGLSIEISTFQGNGPQQLPSIMSRSALVDTDGGFRLGVYEGIQTIRLGYALAGYSASISLGTLNAPEGVLNLEGPLPTGDLEIRLKPDRK